MMEKDGAAAAMVKVSVDRNATRVANIRVGDNNLLIDESEGQAKSPDPYDYILSALGACTAITVQLYAQRKGWPLERVEVALQHGRVHPKDCENCEDAAAKLYQITKQVHFQGDLTTEQRHRLLDISARCPVQKTLEAGIAIKSVLAEQV